MFKTAEAANVAAVLNSIEGLVVTIQAKDQLAGEIQIRFGNDAGPLQGHSATLAHFMLRDMGAKVDDIAEWGETIDGNMLTLAGTLKLSTLSDIVTMTLHDARMPRRLRTLSRGLRDIEIARASDAELTGQANISDGGKRISDSDESDTEQAQSSNESNMEDVRSSATQEYLKRLENLLQAAHRKSDESLSQSRFWLDRYSFKIQYLDRESVDHDLLTFSDETTNRMRLMADTIEDAMQEAAEGSGTDWQPTPTWRTVNYGGVLVRRRAWFNSESGWGRGMSDEDRLEVQAEIQNALTKAKDVGITTVRDFNKMGAMLANKYGFDFEEWSPGQLR